MVPVSDGRSGREADLVGRGACKWRGNQDANMRHFRLQETPDERGMHRFEFQRRGAGSWRNLSLNQSQNIWDGLMCVHETKKGKFW